LQRARRIAEELGRTGEEFVVQYLMALKAGGKIRDFQWTSDANAVAPIVHSHGAEKNPVSDILVVSWITTAGLRHMDIDQRLDKLAERHEALSQSVELLLHTQREAFEKYDVLFQKYDVLFEKHDAAFQKYDVAFEKNEAAMAKNQVLLSQVVESIDSLARIAHAHEQRITGLEDRRQ